MTLPRFTNKELPVFFKTAKRIVRHLSFDLLAKPKAHSQARLLVVTPKHVGSAVTRNRIRRRLKHIFYEGSWHTKSYDYIFVIKKEAMQMPFNELKKLVTTHLTNHEDRHLS